MKTFLSLLIICFTMFASPSLYAKVWEGRNDWNEQWEEKYSVWVAEVSRDADFFLNRNIPIDCADAAYSYRWIFSRIHDLKAAFKISQNVFFTNETNQFDGVPTANNWEEDRRFLKALNHLNANYTKAEFTNANAYPVQISKESLTPGTLFVSAVNRQHVQVLSRTSDRNDQLPISFVQSTTPRRLQSLLLVDYWEGNKPLSAKEGFMKFRWPVKVNGKWSYVPDKYMPYYSEFKYDEDLLKNWSLPYLDKNSEIAAMPTYSTYVYFTLNPKLNPLDAIKVGMQEMLKKFKSRIEFVKQGYEYCVEQGNSCANGSRNYDDWSTPSRDKHIGELIHQVAADVGNIRDMVANPQTYWNDFMYNTKVTEWNGQPIYMIHLFIIWRHKLYSSDPNASIDERWGFNKMDFQSYKPL